MTATLLDGPRVDGRRRAAVREPEPSDRLVWPLVIVAIVPIVVAGVRAVASGWIAVGDNANVLIRSRDVLTSNHPLFGPWSSATIAIGEHVNHPGPLLFDLLAIPTRLAGSGGLAIGVTILNAACVVGIAIFARRAGGARGAVAAVASAAALAWTMGSTLLYDPWNPHVVLFPLLLLLVLAWAMAAGDTLALPVAVAVASLVVQTHGSQVLVVPVLCAACALRLVALRRWEVVRPALAALVVLLVCWAQPVADQVAGEGNLGALARSLGGGGDTSVGLERGVQITADVLAIPPWWARPSFHDGMRYPPGQPRFVDGQPNVDGLPSTVAAGASLAALAAVLVLAAVVARRRGDDAIVTGLAVCGVAIVLAFASTVGQPVGAAGLSAHLQRYLWPIGTLATLLVLAAVLPRRWALVVPAAGTIALAVLTIPAHASRVGPAADAPIIPVVRDLASQLDDVELPEPLLVNTATRYAEPWTSSLMAVLQARGIDFRVDDEGWARQIGVGRRDEGESVARLFFAEGASAHEVPEGARRVAFHDDLSLAERRELGALQRSLRDLAVVLNDEGEAAVAAGGYPALVDGMPSASSMLSDGSLADLLRNGLVEVTRARQSDVGRYEALQTRAERATVAVYVADEVRS